MRSEEKDSSDQYWQIESCNLQKASDRKIRDLIESGEDTSDASKQCSNSRPNSQGVTQPLGNSSASLAVGRDFGPNSERAGIDTDVEFLSVKGEGPSFFWRICEPKKPPVNHKGLVVHPGPLTALTTRTLGGPPENRLFVPCSVNSPFR
jgi:hypothetical protein